MISGELFLLDHVSHPWIHSSQYSVLLVEDDHVFLDNIVLSNIHRPILGNNTALRM